MGRESNIEWTDSTWNPWIGCTKVSAGCKNCYAEKQDGFRKWTPEGWGAGKPRKRTSAAKWKEPIKWNRDAEAAGIRQRVFCASLADVFDAEVDDAWRVDLFEVVRQTPWLDWQLLTKRPENISNAIHRALIVAEGGDPNDAEWFINNDGNGPETELGQWLNDWTGDEPPANVWLGTSVEDQDAADKRIPELLKVPAAVRFLSCEPLLGEVSFRWAMWVDHTATMVRYGSVGHLDGLRGIHWIIVGGESGPGARPMSPVWARRIRDEAKLAGVRLLFKQWGNWYPLISADEASQYPRAAMHEWPDGIRAVNVGKQAAGRLLDGRTHDEFPTPPESPL